MARKVFYSFHFDGDFWRTQQVRNIGALEKDEPVSKNEWEEVKGGGSSAIEAWIGEELSDKSCLICLIGAETSQRLWVTHEIQQAWNAGKGVVGIYIHRLRDNHGTQSPKGGNPFDNLTFVKDPSRRFSSVGPVYDPGFSDSKETYGWIEDNIETVVEDAIAFRKSFKLES